jgi:hypothetical protein
LLSDQDDMYKGYRIPRDSLVIANAWSVSALLLLG